MAGCTPPHSIMPPIVGGNSHFASLAQVLEVPEVLEVAKDNGNCHVTNEGMLGALWSHMERLATAFVCLGLPPKFLDGWYFPEA